MDTPLNKRVADLLHSEHRVSETRLRGLSPEDLVELRAVAAGQRTPQHRVKALGVLAATHEPSVADVLRVALHDGSADPTVRAAGATWLSRLGGMAAEGSLLESLPREPVPAVQHKIIAGLARIGSQASLSQLGALAGDNPAVKEHARFAQAVVAYRHAISGFELPVPEGAALRPAPPGQTTRAPLSPTAPEEALRVLQGTAADSFGVQGHPERVASLRCERRQLAIVLNPDSLRNPVHLATGPALPGYLAVRAETDGSFSTALLVFTWPGPDKTLHISVNRVTGPVEYFGTGEVEGDSLRFTVHAVMRPGATETTVKGRLADGQIMDLQITTGKRFDRLRPSPMQDG